ncbi:MAG: DUF4398 domain-containing protein [Steroidobacteraceae bacterium]
MNDISVRQDSAEQPVMGRAPTRAAPGAYASATTSISAGMRVLTTAPTASVAGYWPTVGPLSGHTLHGAQPPVAELASASTLIRQAEEHGAERFAGAELDRARGKIQSAKDFAEFDPLQAQRLAEEANLDAQCALERVRAAHQR